jgi:phosphate transport system permease protein
MLIVAGAGLIGVPIGLASAVHLSEYASARARSIIKPVLEILAGIPTVVYGYFALTFITPLLRGVVPSTGVFNAASASIVVGIMILPMVASLCDDALRAVPDALRQGAYAVGATPFEVSTRIVIPGALSGIMASFVLAMSRAVGETMAVTIAAGATPNLTLNPLESVQTMTAYIVQVSLGDTPAGTVEYQTIIASSNGSGRCTSERHARAAPDLAASSSSLAALSAAVPGDHLVLAFRVGGASGACHS